MHSSTLFLLLLVAVTTECFVEKEIDFQSFCEDKHDGNYPHPYDCRKFVSCEHKLIKNTNEDKVSVQTCPHGLFYSTVEEVCDWPSQTTCYLLQGRACYGAKDNMYGTVNASHAGNIRTVKLIHVSGHVTCRNLHEHYRSFWGCNSNALGIKNKVNTWITTTANEDGILFPDVETRSDFYGNYYLDGYTQASSVIKIYTGKHHPVAVQRNQELRVWHGEDLMAITEHDNDGKHCAEVWFHYSSFKEETN